MTTYRNAMPVDPGLGLGRAQLLELLNWIVDTHMGYAIPGNTGLDLFATQTHYDKRAAELEGLARLLWGAAFAFNDGGKLRGAPKLLDGIANGADPAHPSYWGKLGGMDQRAVEMAPIAALLLESPGVTKALGEKATANLCRWLIDIQDVNLHASNWRFFRILTLSALKRLGHSVDEKVLASDFDFVDASYIGGGWYGDFTSACRDYYNGFAFHCYSLMYARWFMDEDRERCERYVERSRAFALSYRHWFDDEGGNLAYGRSLTYRFAVACFWPLMAHFGHPAMTMGELRGLWERSLRWWLGKDVFDPLGRITIGYAYPNLLMAEFYNSPQSPLWAMKTMFPLAFPEEHPFWRASPEPCRYDGAVHTDMDGRFITQRTKSGVYMLAGAPMHEYEFRGCIDKYGKFAYSTRHGFGVESAAWINAGVVGDNILAFSADGRDWRIRTKIDECRMRDNELTTTWSPMEGCRVETTQRFTEDGERRTHVVEADRALSFIATGHAADMWRKMGIDSDLPPDGIEPAVRGDTLFSDIRDAGGQLECGVAAMPPNTNLMFPQACVPTLRGAVAPGRTVIDTVLRYGAADGKGSVK